jgi:hypothetical protein
VTIAGIETERQPLTIIGSLDIQPQRRQVIDGASGVRSVAPEAELYDSRNAQFMKSCIELGEVLSDMLWINCDPIHRRVLSEIEAASVLDRD